MNGLAENGISEKALQRFFREIKKQEIDLHSMVIWRNGERVFLTYGYPFSPESMHRMYSSASILLALAILKAVEENKLSLKDKERKYYKDRLPDEYEKNSGTLTIAQLLCMYTGENFSYNKSVFTILVQIVEKAVLSDYIEYLQQKFFKYMDICIFEDKEMCSFSDPLGLSIRMKDFPKLAELVLNKGVWNDMRLLDVNLTERLGRYQVSTAQPQNSEEIYTDRSYGYGSLLWRNRGGGFRIDGEYGQYSLIFPDLNMAVSIMAFEEDQEIILDLFWKYVYPYIWECKIPEEEKDNEDFASEYKALFDWTRVDSEKNWIEGHTYVLQENPVGLQKLNFRYEDDRIIIAGVQNGEEFSFAAGLKGNYCINAQHLRILESCWNRKHLCKNTDEYYITGEFYKADDFTGKKEIRIFIRNLNHTEYCLFNFRIADDGIRIELDNGAWYCVKKRARIETSTDMTIPIIIYGSEGENDESI